jgi:hypothetical protein
MVSESLLDNAQETPKVENKNARIIASWEKHALGWLRQCINHHDLCRMRIPSTCAASRLVYIGQAKDFSDMRLEIRQDGGWNDVPYTVLSHCWGGYMPLQLTEENIDEMTTKIEFGKLHLTFKHAIIATKFLPPDLDVHYIWIDSLCIIQQQALKQDFNIEAPKMGSIYRNALVCFAATFGRNGKAGLFRERNDLSLRPYLARPEWDEKGRTFACEDRRPEQNMLIDSALGQRGWCFQEAILAPRVVHFSAQQLFWECSTLTSNEAYPHGLPERYSSRKSFSLDTWTKHHIGPYGNPETQPYNIWDKMVSLYSQCKLTQNTDKLVAIGSLALGLQKRLEGIDTYVAGLWKSQLPQTLNWELSDCRSGPGAHRPEDWRAPSWSWASADGQVNLNSESSTSVIAHAKVIDLRISYRNNNIALGVTEAELHIRGPIGLVDLEFSHSKEELADSSKYRVFPFTLKGAKFKEAIIQGQLWKPGSNVCRFDTRLGHLTTYPIYALLISSENAVSKGLMLQRHSERPKCWERCGHFTLYEPEDRPTFLRQCAITSVEGCVCESHYDESGEHTIVLV